MKSEPAASPAAAPASLVVADPGGHRTRVPVDPVPFQIGRQPESHLILRDSRVSRLHARILLEGGDYVLEAQCRSIGDVVDLPALTQPG